MEKWQNQIIRATTSPITALGVCRLRKVGGSLASPP